MMYANPLLQGSFGLGQGMMPGMQGGSGMQPNQIEQLIQLNMMLISQQQQMNGISGAFG